MEALAANPEASINSACGGWSETVAAYRFFDNDSVSPEQILQPHREATKRRLREHPVVLIVQDSAELDLHGASAQGRAVFEHGGSFWAL